MHFGGTGPGGQRPSSRILVRPAGSRIRRHGESLLPFLQLRGTGLSSWVSWPPRCLLADRIPTDQPLSFCINSEPAPAKELCDIAGSLDVTPQLRGEQPIPISGLRLNTFGHGIVMSFTPAPVMKLLTVLLGPLFFPVDDVLVTTAVFSTAYRAHISSVQAGGPNGVVQVLHAPPCCSLASMAGFAALAPLPPGTRVLNCHPTKGSRHG